jgi:phosphatidate cytidylyltransferase
LKTRIITAAILGIVVVGCLFYLPIGANAILLGSFLAVAAWEWSALVGWSSAIARLCYTALVVALSICIWRWNDTAEVFTFIYRGAVVWWFLCTVLVILAQRRRLGGLIRIASNATAGVIVLLAAWSALVWLLSTDRKLLFAVFMLVWVADGAAFFVGRRWGKRRLAPNVSPGKSWDGVLGGIGFATLSGVLISYTIALSDEARIAFVMICVGAICFSIVGDLFESMLKRNIGVKDSGQILPGHGGVLDRIDGLVAAAPIFVAGLHSWVRHL